MWYVDVVQIVDTSGVVKNTYDYDVWGNFLKKEETIDNHYTYFGQTYDETTGLYYLRGRYYDPTTGRFTQQDSAEDGYNWYIYGNNNPVMYVDYSGLYSNKAPLIFIYNSLKNAHYNRNEGNVDLPKNVEEAIENNWDNGVPAACHQFMVVDGNEENVKYVSPDGKREVIFDSNGTIVIADEDVGTYNYIPSGNAVSNVGHFAIDVVPWIIWGNTENDSTTILRRIVAFIGG